MELDRDRPAADTSSGSELGEVRAMEKKRFPGEFAALVTGAASGIGRATAERFATEGARVALVDLRQERLREAAKNIGAYGTEALICAGDVNDASTWDNAAAQIEEHWGGKLHAVVHAAGIQQMAPLQVTVAEVWEKLWRTNVVAIVSGTRRLLPLLARSAPASVTVLASAAAFLGAGGQGAYAATKAALIAAVRCWAVEWAVRRVRFNAVAPGVVETELSAQIKARVGEKGWEALTHRHLLGLGKPEDIAGVIAFLASEDARWITGATLVVDGGFTAH